MDFSFVELKEALRSQILMDIAAVFQMSSLIFL